jgi:D-glycero-alpha-D-manno-heptose 1-phosphate guanylyltransferase
LQKIKGSHVLITNGDTLFKVDVPALVQQHLSSGAECSLALKQVPEAERFGGVIVNERQQILSFSEKGTTGEGSINGGLYVLDKTKFFQRSFPFRFSFETDYLQSAVASGQIYGFQQEAYFIDIGDPARLPEGSK